MDIDDLTLGQIKEISAMVGCGTRADPGPWRVGEIYLIRTVTTYMLGRVVAVGEHEIELEDAAWVACTGRFSNAMKTGDLDEVEPCPDGQWIIGRGAIADAGPWSHGLERDTK